jgi:hypothetical protein
LRQSAGEIFTNKERCTSDDARNLWIIGSSPIMTMKRKQLQAKLEAVFPRLVLSLRRGRESERGAINTIVIPDLIWNPGK